MASPWAAPLPHEGCGALESPSFWEAEGALEGATPLLLRGLLLGQYPQWLPPHALASNASVRLVVNPSDSAPLKLGEHTLVRPHEMRIPLQHALSTLHTARRGYHAYISALPLETTPELSETILPSLKRVISLAGEGLQHTNVWINPRHEGMKSALHYDGHDNLLVQLRGVKSVLLLPPESHARLGYIPRVEHMYTFDRESLTFPSHVPRGGREAVENHAHLEVFAEGGQNHLIDSPFAAQGDLGGKAGERGEEGIRGRGHAEREGKDGRGHSEGMDAKLAQLGPEARVCALRPGEVLFIPALWSHAVVSYDDSSDSPPVHHAAAKPLELNVAVNLWSDTMPSLSCSLPSPHCSRPYPTPTPPPAPPHRTAAHLIPPTSPHLTLPHLKSAATAFAPSNGSRLYSFSRRRPLLSSLHLVPPFARATSVSFPSLPSPNFLPPPSSGSSAAAPVSSALSDRHTAGPTRPTYTRSACSEQAG